MKLYETPPPIGGFTAEHFSTHVRLEAKDIGKVAVVQFAGADWLITPEQLMDRKEK